MMEPETSGCSPSGFPTPTIAEEINYATRKQHTHLNHLITERISLALPPSAVSPIAFGQGLAIFAQIYFAIETASRELSATSAGHVHPADAERDAEKPTMLSHLLVSGLPRYQSLFSDIRHISRSTGAQVENILVREQLELYERIKNSILAKPHLLVAYTWVMYMAIFSGGRWIRQRLLEAGPAFWSEQQGAIYSEEHEEDISVLPGFTFLSFDGDQDGEDIKARLKAEVTAAELFLTQEQRQDVVETAQELFDDCIALVGMLDRAVGQNVTERKSRRYTVRLFAIAIVVLLCYVYSRNALL